MVKPFRISYRPMLVHWLYNIIVVSENKLQYLEPSFSI